MFQLFPHVMSTLNQYEIVSMVIVITPLVVIMKDVEQ